jgi:two-component system, LytTR family, response regulator LytT
MDNEISVLIVEDEGLIAQHIKILLQGFGYNVTGVVYKYHKAVNAINELTFDVLITDIDLGNGIDEKSGIQIAQLVKQTKNCPIIFLTAFSDKDTILKATALSPSAYLVKPVNAASLFAALQLAVENFNTQNISTIDEANTADYFFIKQGDKKLKIFWKDVYHLEAVKNYVKIKTKEYSSSLLLRGSLQDVLQNRMPPFFRNDFVKINRAEAMDKKAIKEVGKGIIKTNYGTFKTSTDFKKDNFK